MSAMTTEQLERRVRRVPEQLARARRRVAQLEAEARELRMHDLLTVRTVTMMTDATWVLDVHIDTETQRVRLTATDRTAQTTHYEPMGLLTTAAVRAGIDRMIARHGKPCAIWTDYGALWVGLGDAIGVPHWCSDHAALPAATVPAVWGQSA